MRTKPDDLLQVRDRAVAALVQAAAALCEYPFPTHQGIAAALLHAGLGVHLISRLDTGEHGLVLAEGVIKRTMDARGWVSSEKA